MAVVCAEEPKISFTVDLANVHGPRPARVAGGYGRAEKACFRVFHEFPDFSNCLFPSQVFAIFFALILVDRIHSQLPNNGMDRSRRACNREVHDQSTFRADRSGSHTEGPPALPREGDLLRLRDRKSA